VCAPEVHPVASARDVERTRAKPSARHSAICNRFRLNPSAGRLAFGAAISDDGPRGRISVPDRQPCRTRIVRERVPLPGPHASAEVAIQHTLPRSRSSQRRRRRSAAANSGRGAGATCRDAQKARFALDERDDLRILVQILRWAVSKRRTLVHTLVILVELLAEPRLGELLQTAPFASQPDVVVLDVDQLHTCIRKCLFFEISLLGVCLSRACLGKMIIFSIKWRKRGVFSPGSATSPAESVQRVKTLERMTIPAANAFFSAFFILSRACLGNILIVFRIEMPFAKRHFLHPVVERPSQSQHTRARSSHCSSQCCSG
jgi:hypothetical protein